MGSKRALILAILMGMIAIGVGCTLRAETTPVFSNVTPAASAEAILHIAKEDLAQRLALPISEINVARVEAVEWPDTSLGCPKPNTAYAQVITPGYRLILVAAGKGYEYHSDEGKRVIFCPKEEAVPFTAAGPPTAKGAMELAKKDLAERLGIAVEEITLVSVVTTDFPLQDLGCPQPDQKEPGFTLPSFVIGHEVVLHAEGRDYTYRVHRSQVVLCGSSD